MSAPNFFKTNASKFYVLDCRTFWKDDEQLESYEEGCTVYDDTEDEIEYIQENATSAGPKSGYYNRWKRPGDSDKYRGRDSVAILEKVEGLNLSPACGMDLTIEIQYNVGRYQAGCLDWSIYACDENGCSFDGEYAPEDVEGLVRDALDYVSWRESYWNPGLIKMQAKNIAQKVRRAVEKAMEEAEDFCRQNCTGVYELAYMFSNGEAGYNKVA